MANTTKKPVPGGKIEGESEKAYEAFRAYLEMPANDRSLLKLAKHLGYKTRKQKDGRVRGASTLETWCGKNKWNDRIAEYAEHMALVGDKKVEALEKRDAKKWADRRAQQRERAYETAKRLITAGDQLLDKATVMLQTPTHNRREVVDENGTTIILEPTGDWKLRDAATMAKAASAVNDSATKLVAMSCDMATETVKFEFDLGQLPREFIRRIANGEPPARVVQDFQLLQGGKAG